MKNLNEMKSERTAMIEKMENITKNEVLTDELRAEYDGFEGEVTILDGDIQRAEKQEAYNKSIVTVEVERAEEAKEDTFQDFLRSAVEGTGPLSYRADPILTTTDTGMVNKTVANKLEILTSPGEAFLRKLGVTFYPNLNGNFVVPNVGEDTATFVGEDASAASANMAPASLTLAARRVSHSQTITKETLAQTNPAIYSGIVQNLVNGIWNAITNDVFDTLQTDAASQVYTATASGLSYGDIVGMEASIGGLDIGAGAYVTTPSVKAYLKSLAVLGTDNGPVWQGETVNGYSAYGVPAANTNKVYFGDFGKCAIGQWGGVEIVVDPYTQAKQGRIVLTAIALADTGVTNKRGLVFTTDVSAGI